MQFEFDPEKSRLNLEKHGIDFNQAQSLWKDPFRILVEARSTEEPRKAVIAQWKNKVWFAVYTLRRTQIRIISVRRARKREVEYYEKD